MSLDLANARTVLPPTGPERSARSWQTEAPLRMLMNNLHPEVAEDPQNLVVYGGVGRAARSWEDFDRIVESLRALGDEETLLVQSGRPAGIFRTHPDAPGCSSPTRTWCRTGRPGSTSRSSIGAASPCSAR